MAETNKNLRKVLINRHSVKAEAPIAKDMYLGEIAISHPTDLCATTIYTKNGDVMVPFASCAMTKTMIDNAIKAADMDYEVVKGAGEKYIKVDTATATTEDGKKTTFTLSTSDVASDTDLQALSSATESKFENMTNILTGLTDLVITSVTGDDAIIVTSGQTSTGASNTITLTHKDGLATSGFKKLTTDKYGHVTASEDVVTRDIEKLGFKTSADTATEIAAAIESLSAVSASTGKYFTAIGVKDGKLVKEEAELPKLSSATTGNGNVVTDIQVSDHQITFVKGMTVASDADLRAVSGIVDTFSAATEAKFADTDAAITTLSGNVVSYVDSVSGNIVSVINAMDKNAEVVAGQVVTTVSQVDGKVAETKASVKDLQLGGYSKDPNATGSIDATDTINAALSKLENVIGANKITNSDKSIVVTEPTSIGATTGVKVNINPDEKVIKLGNEGLYTNLDLVKITSGLGATVKERYEFRDSDGNKIGESIDIAKDSHIVSITYNGNTQKLIYQYIDVSGATQTTEVDMGSLVLETEVENGIQAVNNKLSIKLDTTGDDTGNDGFLTVGPDGLKLDGVSDAIKAAVEALNVTDAAVAGQYVSSVNETNGKIAVTRANVSDAVLTGYSKGEKPAETAIAATDDVKGAIAKLEHQIDATKAAATTKVAKDTNANHLTLSSSTAGDGSVTYTIGESDIASKAALDAEIAARKDVDGQTGQTYVANADANYISAASSLNDADVKLDAALKAEETARANQDDKIEASIGLAENGSHVTTNGTYTSAATTVVGEIAALDSALKAVSDRVGKKLTFADDATDVEYDGSVDKTITFGSPVNATDITGRSLSITNGVVDVEIIDCGEY